MTVLSLLLTDAAVPHTAFSSNIWEGPLLCEFKPYLDLLSDGIFSIYLLQQLVLYIYWINLYGNLFKVLNGNLLKLLAHKIKSCSYIFAYELSLRVPGMIVCWFLSCTAILCEQWFKFLFHLWLLSLPRDECPGLLPPEIPAPGYGVGHMLCGVGDKV